MSGWRRALLAAVLATLLLVDGAYWSRSFAQGDIESALLLLYPDRVVGREMVLSLVDVRSVATASYTIGEGQWWATVKGDPVGLEVGDELYVRGVFEAPGVLRETWRVTAPQRGGKRTLGLLAMALVVGLSLAGVRPTPTGLSLRG